MNEVINELNNASWHRQFYFDFSKVETITVDAIMYTLAILRNLKRLKYKKVRVFGNNPKNEDARKLLDLSGFSRYVQNQKTSYETRSDRIQIINGDITDTDVAKAICDFASLNGKNKSIISPLYIALIELMGNTVQHAYKTDDKNLFTKNWYIYAEEKDDKIEFVFLDTGLGIPSTIRKRLHEKVPLLKQTDSRFILSALRGEERSATGKKNRGTGLPVLFESATTGIFNEFNIHSGMGVCKICRANQIEEACNDHEVELFGTLYYWNMVIEER